MVHEGRPSNAFDALRLVAALAVLYSHSFALLREPEPRVLGLTLGGFSVVLFFAISGFLISQSWDRVPSLYVFAMRRALRIAPGLIVAVLFTALIVGSLSTRLPISEYIMSSQTWRFILSNASAVCGVEDLPGVFEGMPHTAANGSLWTLRYEIVMYVLVALAGLVLPRRLGAPALLVTCLVCWFGTMDGSPQDRQIPLPVLWRLGLTFDALELSRLGAVFFSAAVIYYWRVPLRWDLAAALLAAVSVGSVLVVPSGIFQMVAIAIAVPYITLVVGNRGSVPLPGDISYGVYVYAFPVQQFLTQIGTSKAWGWIEIVLSSAAVTVVLAMASWKLVESPSIQWSRVTWRPPVRKIERV